MDTKNDMESPTKIAKVDKDNVVLNQLNKFKFKRILNENNQNKLIFIHAIRKFEANENNEDKEENAIIIFEKPHFNKDEIEALIDNNYSTKVQITNDIYNKFCVYPVEPYSNVEVQLIYPATQAHINKYTAQEMFVLNETYDDYKNITLPCVEKYLLNLNWVYNILEHKKEAERIVFEDPDESNGFILLPDMKWDGHTTENLYLLAIAHRKSIKSLRDLTADDISLLENIYNKSIDAISAKYSLNSSKIRAYIHYLPSFYHLHVHFTHISYRNAGIECERAHLLSNVIENLKLCSNYYQKAKLTFLIRRNDDLFKLYESRFNENRDT